MLFDLRWFGGLKVGCALWFVLMLLLGLVFVLVFCVFC